MKLTVLVDNNTCIDHYFIGEPGVSYFVEEGNFKMLFDLGYSDVFLRNGAKMNVDFLNLDAIAISHSHLDHTWGLEPLIKAMTEAQLEDKACKRPLFVAHPDVFISKTFFGNDEFGMNVSLQKVEKYFKPNLSKNPVWLTDRLVFLGEIPRKNTFEAQQPIGKLEVGDDRIDDYSMDDSALVFCSKQGLVVITGCSHAGICNIIEHAKTVCRDNRIHDVIGGLHLLKPSADQLNGTVSYFGTLGSEAIHACHCTDLDSKIALSQVVKVLEVGVGMTFEYE